MEAFTECSFSFVPIKKHWRFVNRIDEYIDENIQCAYATWNVIYEIKLLKLYNIFLFKLVKYLLKQKVLVQRRPQLKVFQL